MPGSFLRSWQSDECPDIGTRQPGEAVTFPVEGVDGGSISMLAVKVG